MQHEDRIIAAAATLFGLACILAGIVAGLLWGG